MNQDRPGNKRPIIPRPCKTVLEINTRCHSDVLRSLKMEQASDESPSKREAEGYIRTLCKAHLPIINQLIQSYRLASYDYFAYEVSPWEVPIWHLLAETMFRTYSIHPYKEMDAKPVQVDIKTRQVISEYQLVSVEDLAKNVSQRPTPGEFELMDGLNLMERGDFSGAVRRVATAIEVLTDSLLAAELRKSRARGSQQTASPHDKASLRQRLHMVGKLSLRPLPKIHLDELERTVRLRNRIVHQAYRLSFAERGSAQRSVDTACWTFNWLEDRPDRRDIREGRIGLRSLGRDLGEPFNAQITEAGVLMSPRAIP